MVVDCYTPLQPHRVTPLSGSTGGLCWGARGEAISDSKPEQAGRLIQDPSVSHLAAAASPHVCVRARKSVCMRKKTGGNSSWGQSICSHQSAQPRQHGIKRTQSRTVRFSRARRNFHPLWIWFVLTNPGRNLICADRIPARGGFVLSSPCPIRGDSATSHQSAINQQSQRFPFSIPLPSGPDCRQSALPRYFATSKAR